LLNALIEQGHLLPPAGWSTWEEWRCTKRGLPQLRTLVF